jgi:hypothetical protein
MLDPRVLAQCLPGCDELVACAPGEYEMKMKMAIASFAGLFAGKVRVADPNPPVSYRLIVEGAGKAGFLKGEGTLELVPGGAGTEIRYQGDAQVGGTIAAVGQRLIDATSRMMIRKFFDKLKEIAEQA